MPRSLTLIEIKNKKNFILKNAFELFEDRTFKTFKMDDLASRCNLSKGILFKYFQTKEMLFLSMLNQLYENMFTNLDIEMRNHKGMNIEEFKEYNISVFRRSFERNPSLLKLVEIKKFLEENQSYDFAKKSKVLLYDLLLEYAQNILLKVDGLTLAKITNLFMFQSFLLSGYLGARIKEGIVMDVVEDNDLSILNVDFEELSIQTLKCYMDREL